MNERMRLAFLSGRDGLDIARQWALSSANHYQQAIDTQTHFASQSDWRPRFTHDICELTICAQTGIYQDVHN